MKSKSKSEVYMVSKCRMLMFIVLCALGLLAPVVYADGNGGNFNGGQASGALKCSGSKYCKLSEVKHNRKGINKLDLTDEQRKLLKENRKKQADAMKAVLEELKSNKEALDKELVNPNLDMNKITQIQTQIKSIQAQMADNRLNSILEVKKILTPDQFSKFIELKKEHHFKGHKENKADGHHQKYCNKREE